MGVEITVLTPVFNRKMELKRCMDSVKEQTFRNFEYIIVNDGSTENIDDMINEFMDAVSFPVMYIKKDNGGVHTARNLGIQYARGEMLAMIDSDDELIPYALETFISIWKSIPDKSKFCQVRCCCQDQNGNLVGDSFPENINSVSWKIRKKICHKTIPCEYDVTKDVQIYAGGIYLWKTLKYTRTLKTEQMEIFILVWWDLLEQENQPLSKNLWNF